MLIVVALFVMERINTILYITKFTFNFFKQLREFFNTFCDPFLDVIGVGRQKKSLLSYVYFNLI